MSYDLDLVKNYIGFENGLAVNNPATGEQIAVVKDYSVAETEAAVEAANIAFKTWAAKTAKERAAILRKWYELILENTEALAQLITAECGKPLFEARGEVAYAASFIEWFAEEGKRIYGDVIPTHASDKRIIALKQPIGVIAAITPWNFPLAMITRKVGPALAAGCTALVKPAEATPLSALALEELAFQAGVPEGVMKTVTTTKPADIGNVFTTHPTIRKITFTGSTAVGKILMQQSASTVKKVSMELGGNAPFIVFDDADIDAAVAGAMVSKYRNAGQTCVCANRFFIHEDIHDEFVEKFKAAIEALNVGNGAHDDVHVGPVINSAAVDKVEGLVNSATSEGADLILGGERHDAGDNFYTPTLLTNVKMDMEIANSEIFGPVSAIIKFKDENEVIEMANDTPYGLACYFYSRDLGRVWRVTEALEYGIVGVNEGIISTELAPFGGVKESGVGREGSKYGIDDYVEIKYCLMGGLMS
ncbi:NAD-dependent succinate-semialdehyde dehydrogenase [Pseudemcibacter aquimaris]|uniref:NAD-dependent succinate-semialdehyde dehydrogenase n=1 Tax=Pseudemcibacter aquimaris TaxID=2857064 RepID=UPI0020119F28|nr:NAD-dependent succinate-semialdehyde dehydrogenase [Pseudemcibacter aquimaris]MCC3862555.1 NAD-dependent succinate-semialdehyde dehydrogenase [Pseudemcibacter aquimaris]WDU57926.1 NAD-dependent succinate-semialdehyde dehydrogenase [Pseudemcibacter aquimaris]